MKKKISRNEIIAALVAARKNSKGIKNKNLITIKKKTIFNIALDLAYKNKTIDVAILSSDSKKILNKAKKNKKLFLINRSSNLSLDNTPMLPVMQNAVNLLEKKLKKKIKFMIILDPTSPFRSKKNIEEGIKRFKNKKLDLLVSVNKADHNPYFSILEKYGKFYNLSKGINLNLGSRQVAKQVYNVNTVIWIYSRKAIMLIKKRIPKKTDIFLTSNKRSLELNSLNDFKKLKNQLKKR